MKKCKVKSIPVTEVTEGMQVYYPNYTTGKSTFIIGKVDDYIELCNNGKVIDMIPLINKSELKTIVVEYEYEYDDDSRQRVYDTKQLPLKDSDWQQVIDDKSLDSGKEVEVEIVEYNYRTKTVEPYGTFINSKEHRIAQLNREIVYTVPKYIIENALDALRMAANTLKSRKRETAMDRQIEFSERLLKWVVNGGQGKVPNWIPRNDEKEN